MAVFTKYYYGTPGGYSITDSALAYANILKVAKDGVVHRKWDSDALYTGREEFKYGSSTGLIEFNPDNPFAVPPMGRPNKALMTKIMVKYEI